MRATEPNDGRLQARLLEWFEHEQRRFPWRSDHRPYAVLIAEKLLQQTAAREVVVDAYEEMLRRYPSPQRLAAAPVGELRDIVKPLGLGYRAREIKAMAQHLVANHDGKVPSVLDDLMSLPGVGDYTARAVLSFAFNEDVPVVDTNVARFLYRLHGLTGPMPANPARKKSLLALAGELVPPGRSRDYNWAILDLCAKTCKPNDPLCDECPASPWCCYAEGCVPRALGPDEVTC